MNKYIQKSIGPEAAKLLDQLQRDGKYIFNTHEAMKISKKNRAATNSTLSKLCKKGSLARIKKGHYLILQSGRENTQLSNWPVIVTVLAGENPYFISHYSAMRLHGMTTHALNTVTITMQKRMRKKTIKNFSYHFIYKAACNFWGMTSCWVDKQNKVRVSNLERTLLDALDNPQLCGGITEIVQGIKIKQETVDWEKLLSYAKKFPNHAAIKRLGFLLDILNLADEQLKAIERIITPTKHYILLEPGLPKSGKYISRWRVQVNINLEELIANIDR